MEFSRLSPVSCPCHLSCVRMGPGSRTGCFYPVSVRMEVNPKTLVSGWFKGGSQHPPCTCPACQHLGKPGTCTPSSSDLPPRRTPSRKCLASCEQPPAPWTHGTFRVDGTVVSTHRAAPGSLRAGRVGCHGQNL